jgi:micrococcal nuclease
LNVSDDEDDDDGLIAVLPGGDDDGSLGDGDGLDPRFRTCGAAIASGFGNYRAGIDPEYSWYWDRDGDGIVCER